MKTTRTTMRAHASWRDSDDSDDDDDDVTVVRGGDAMACGRTLAKRVRELSREAIARGGTVFHRAGGGIVDEGVGAVAGGDGRGVVEMAGVLGG